MGGIQALLLPIAIATLIFHVQSSESLRPARKEKKEKLKTEFFFFLLLLLALFFFFFFLFYYYLRRSSFFFSLCVSVCSFNFFYLTALPLRPGKYNRDKKGGGKESQVNPTSNDFT